MNPHVEIIFPSGARLRGFVVRENPDDTLLIEDEETYTVYKIDPNIEHVREVSRHGTISHR